MDERGLGPRARKRCLWSISPPQQTIGAGEKYPPAGDLRTPLYERQFPPAPGNSHLQLSHYSTGGTSPRPRALPVPPGPSRFLP